MPTSIQYDNPKEPYRKNNPRFLKSFHIETQKDTETFVLPDTTDSTKAWEVNAPRYRYVFQQVVGQRFTDPGTYAESDRKPPTTLAGLKQVHTYSQVNLPDVMAAGSAGYTAIGGVSTPSPTNNPQAIADWMIVKSGIDRIAVGVWEETIHMAAFSDFIWLVDSFTKREVPKSTTITNSPVK